MRAPARRPTTRAARTLLVAVLPGVVLAVGFFYLYYTATPGAFGRINPAHHRVEHARPGHEYRIATTLYVFGATSLACVAIAYSQLARRNSTRGLAAAAAGGIVTAGVMWRVELGAPLYRQLSPAVYDALLSADALERMSSYVQIGNAMAALAIWAIVVAGVDMLRELDEEQHGRVLGDVRALLLTSSVLLATGVVFMRAWMSWPLAYLKVDSELGSAFGEVVTWVTAHAAVVFATTLVAYFVVLAKELETKEHRLLRAFARQWTWYLALTAPVGIQIALELFAILAERGE